MHLRQCWSSAGAYSAPLNPIEGFREGNRKAEMERARRNGWKGTEMEKARGMEIGGGVCVIGFKRGRCPCRYASGCTSLHPHNRLQTPHQHPQSRLRSKFQYSILRSRQYESSLIKHLM